MHARARFAAEHPEVFLIDTPDTRVLEKYLRDRGWIAARDEVTGVARAGEGNMNLALRVATSSGGLVLKQGRPWVEKYPDIAAPWDRTLIEGRFYQTVAAIPDVARHMPAAVGLDEQSRVLALEDVRGAHDLTGMYSGDRISGAMRGELLDWLRALHRVELAPSDRAVFTNRAMRALNHEHLVRYPLDPGNGLGLDAITAGLAGEARRLQRKPRYVDRVAALGRKYLEDGPTFVHGDFFPGSWLAARDDFRVIDYEFAFTGAREFDVGVMAAHLMFAGEDENAPDDLAQRYGDRLDRRLVRGFAGVELMRRLIGVAQLPLQLDLEGKRRLLDASGRLVLEN